MAFFVIGKTIQKNRLQIACFVACINALFLEYVFHIL